MDLSGSLEDLNRKLYLEIHEWCDIDEVRREINMRVDSIRDDRLRRLCSTVLVMEKDFWIRPASVEHHSMAGGLAKHTLEVLVYSAQILSMVRSEYVLSTDLVIAGACLHDIGKARDFDNPINGNSGMHHVDTGIEIVKNAMSAFTFSEEEKKNVLDIMRTHHTAFLDDKKSQYSTLEGYVVHLADSMSAIFDSVLPKLCLGKKDISCYLQTHIKQAVFK